LLPALHPVQSLSREDIIIFAVTGIAEKSSPAHPVTVAGMGEPDPTGKGHCYVATRRKLYATKKKVNKR
jgi:hypothetical protein